MKIILMIFKLRMVKWLMKAKILIKRIGIRENNKTNKK
jgi:hypothetical protein